jgi:exopolysaccharide biosynthesis polyprenyl glycosylphosphotransferase
MSVTPEAHSAAPAGAATRRRAPATGVATRVNRVLFATHRWPWVAVDLLVVTALYELGIRVSPYGGYEDLVSPYVALSAVYAIAFVATALGLGYYDRQNRFDIWAVLRNGLLATLLASGVNLAFHYFTLYEVVGRLTLVYGAAFAFTGVVLLRGAMTLAVRRHRYRFAVIGSSGQVWRTVSVWAETDKHAKLYELVPWDAIFVDPKKPTVDELVDADVAEIVVASGSVSDQEAVDFALVALQANVPVVDERTFYAHLFERLPLDEISKRWILEQGLARPQGVIVASKRLADIVAAGVGLLLLSPILLIIAVAVRLSSAGPILFVQERQGLFNRPFRMLKFRTMHHQPDAADTSFTRIGDARVTGVGRVLRRLHLDELPQLLNILRGEMSLVGPRPETVEFAREMDAELPLYELRYLVRPGLTGHAQLKQGYAMDTVLDTQDKLAYDLYYLCNYSLRLDLQILLRTAFFLTRGAR